MKGLVSNFAELVAIIMIMVALAVSTATLSLYMGETSAEASSAAPPAALTSVASQ